MQGDERELAGLDPEPGGRPGGAEAVLESNKRVDHRVADEVHPGLGDPLGPQVYDRLIGMQEEQLGELVGDDPVDLLGHGAVEAAQAGLDVGDRDAHLDRGQHRRQGRVDVARDEDEVGLLGLQHRLQPLHRPRRLRCMGPRAHLQHVVRGRHPELLEEDLRHQPVVVLAGVDDRVAALGQAGAQGGDHRRRLDEVRPGPDHVEDPHRGASVPRLAAGAPAATPKRGRLLQYPSRCQR
jgi:hypothetical protein